MSDTSFTEVMHPQDPAYLIRRQSQIDQLLKLNMTQLDRQLRYAISQPPPRDEMNEMSRRILSNIWNSPTTPDVVKAGNILGTTSGSGITDGSALIRQDLAFWVI